MRVKGFGAMGYPFQNARVNLANCLVNLQDWPSAGTTVPNETPNYPTWNGNANANRYVLQSTGASSFTANGTTDWLLVPGQTAPVENIANVTIELGLYLTSRSNYQYVLSKGGSVAAGWCLATYPTNAFGLVRYDNNGTSYIKWQTPNGSFAAGNFYDIQFTQALSPFGTAPSIIINGVPQSLTPTNYQTATTYHSDASYDFGFANNDMYSSGGPSVTFYFLRCYNAILSRATLLNNYNADRWRFGQVF